MNKLICVLMIAGPLAAQSPDTWCADLNASNNRLINAARSRLLTAKESKALIDAGASIFVQYLCSQGSGTSSAVSQYYNQSENEKRFHELLLQQFKMRLLKEESDARRRGKQ